MSRWGRLAIPAAVVVAVALSCTAAIGAGNSQPQVLRFKGAHGGGTSTTGGNLVDRGGQITPASHTYAIFWGNQSAWYSDVQSGIASMFSGFNGSNLLGIGQQYMRGAAISSAWQGAKTDASSPQSKVSPSTLGAEVAKVYGNSLDPNGIYFVYTSNFPRGGNFCAWHSLATVNGQRVAVAYMPNTGGIAGCDPGNLYGVSGSEDLRSLANVSSHEFMEAVTDTLPASGSYAWLDNSGSEIGDKCAWQFSGPVKLSDGTTWQLQEEWSNSISGCAQGQ